jgi:hypothetical protein
MSWKRWKYEYFFIFVVALTFAAAGNSAAGEPFELPSKVNVQAQGGGARAPKSGLTGPPETPLNENRGFERLSAKGQYIRFDSESNCVEAFVRAPVPGDSTAKAADRILEARERAELLLYLRLVDFLFGARIEGWDTRRSDVRSEEGKNRVNRVSGSAVQIERERDVGGHVMRNIELSSSRWDGRFFEIYGRFPMPRMSLAGERVEEETGERAETPKQESKKAKNEITKTKSAKSGKKARRRK